MTRASGFRPRFFASTSLITTTAAAPSLIWLAFAAVTADPAIGLLLPCNVTVEAIDATHSMVRLVDPQAMLASSPSGAAPALRGVADDASQRMSRVLARLQVTGRKS